MYILVAAALDEGNGFKYLRTNFVLDQFRKSQGDGNERGLLTSMVLRGRKYL